MNKHQKEVKKLEKIEIELTKMILDKNDLELSDKFFKWQDQRNACNKGLIKVFEAMVETHK